MSSGKFENVTNCLVVTFDLACTVGVLVAWIRLSQWRCPRDGKWLPQSGGPKKGFFPGNACTAGCRNTPFILEPQRAGLKPARKSKYATIPVKRQLPL